MNITFVVIIITVTSDFSVFIYLFIFLLFVCFFDCNADFLIFTPSKAYPRSTTITVTVPPQTFSVFGETLDKSMPNTFQYTTENIVLRSVAPDSNSNIPSNQVFILLFDLVCTSFLLFSLVGCNVNGFIVACGPQGYLGMHYPCCVIVFGT